MIVQRHNDKIIVRSECPIVVKISLDPKGVGITYIYLLEKTL